MIEYLSLLGEATGRTLFLWICSSVLSLGFGGFTGIVRAGMFRSSVISPLFDVITMLLRGVPLYAQLMIAYFAIPQLLGMAPSEYLTGIVTLGLCSGAYTSEIIRGTFNNIDEGQWKAGTVLGYSRWQKVRYLIGPQVVQRALPSLSNEYLMVLKSTSLLGSIGILELTKIGTNIMYRTFNPLPVCCAIALIYLLLSGIIAALFSRLERSYNAHS